ncbi:MAG: hypothetical protein ABH846_01470 [Patescibacteria group bacterium]
MKKTILISVLMVCFAAGTLSVEAADFENYKGKIFLQVQENGEAWYVIPETNTRYYLQSGDHAYDALEMFGLGISNDDIWKIPVGVSSTSNIISYDVDRDGLSNSLESALGTKLNDADTDDDGYDDMTEYVNGYNPFGEGHIPIDNALTERLKGYILLQVESNGEAWYVNPADGRRYYMEDGQAAYDLMRYIGVGITNANLESIAIDASSPTPPTSDWISYIFSRDNFSVNIDFPSYSYVAEPFNDLITASILDGKSSISLTWYQGSKTVKDLLGDTVDENRCGTATYGSNPGTECVGVTQASMNVFIFENQGYTFRVLDHNGNSLNNFPASEWQYILSSINVYALE